MVFFCLFVLCLCCVPAISCSQTEAVGLWPGRLTLTVYKMVYYVLLEVHCTLHCALYTVHDTAKWVYYGGLVAHVAH